MAVTRELERPQSKLIPWTQRLQDAPWWALVLIFLGVLFVYLIFTSPTYQDAFIFLIAGVKFTIFITLTSFLISLVLGLVTGWVRVSKNIFAYTIATIYVEVVRGIPLLVQLIYVAFVLVPMGVQMLNGLGGFITQHIAWAPLVNLALFLKGINIQSVDMSTRAIVGLAFGYGAYEAEVFRAGIESIAKGQMEAARSLGMSYFQAMRYIILPQAIRRVLPPLGNDFIAMLKDSSLCSALAVRELTQLGKLNRARTFRTFETWNTVTFIYLLMTICLSMLVKFIERRMSFEE